MLFLFILIPFLNSFSLFLGIRVYLGYNRYFLMCVDLDRIWFSFSGFVCFIRFVWFGNVDWFGIGNGIGNSNSRIGIIDSSNSSSSNINNSNSSNSNSSNSRIGMDNRYSGIRYNSNISNNSSNVNPIWFHCFIKLYLFINLFILNLIIIYYFLYVWCCVDFYMIEVVNLRLSCFVWFMVLVVILVSSIVIVCSIDYLCIMDSYIFLLYLSLFQFSMIIFVLCNDIIIIFFSWDWLGLISYLCINFWSCKTKSGIKAVIYNQVGDLCFLMTLSFTYSFMGFINYYPFLSFSILICFVSLVLFSFESSVILYFCFILFIIFFSKSAQLPLSSWLLNAMSAPTPVSSLLHSSTMVIAGVYLGLIMYPIILLVIDTFSLVVILLFVIPIYSLIWSVIKAISLSDIKSMIAFSTISQISYMFVGMYGAFSLVCIFHITVHALFKSLLFLLSGSLIHLESNWQSIYKLKINNSFINISFILAGSVLIISLSKEGIIHSSHCIISSLYVIIILVLGGIFTMIYTLKIYGQIHYAPLRSTMYFKPYAPLRSTLTNSISINSFISSNLVSYNNVINFSFFSNLSQHKNQLSFILPWLTISSIFIDQSLEYLFSISFSSIYYNTLFCSNLLSIDLILDFSLVYFVFIFSIILSGLLGLVQFCLIPFSLFNSLALSLSIPIYLFYSSNRFNSFISFLLSSSYNRQWDYSNHQFLTNFIFSSRSTFFVLPFQYFIIIYSCFFFKGPIHLIEIYTGLNSYSLYHIYYYSSLLIVLFLIIILFLFIVLF